MYHIFFHFDFNRRQSLKINDKNTLRIKKTSLFISVYGFDSRCLKTHNLDPDAKKSQSSIWIWSTPYWSVGYLPNVYKVLQQHPGAPVGEGGLGDPGELYPRLSPRRSCRPSIRTNQVRYFSILVLMRIFLPLTTYFSWYGKKIIHGLKVKHFPFLGVWGQRKIR